MQRGGSPQTLPPDHLIHDAGVGLNNLDNLGGNLLRVGVRHHAERVRLQLVVVVEAHGLVHVHQRVARKARGLQALTTERETAVQNGHLVDSRELILE